MDSLRFADFVLHRKTRQLTKGTSAVSIGSRAFDLLDLLVAQRDRVVTRDEIMDAVWPGTVVRAIAFDLRVG